jgi:hypothetical protein
MERRNLFIVTKTYPAISKKYRETVCTAGILLDNDLNPLSWIRIYPIRFRLLDDGNQFKRWSIISAEIEKNDKDFRSESYRINDQSIQLIQKISTEDNWSNIKRLVLPFKTQSTAEIRDRGDSLGIIKPLLIKKTFSKTDSREWDAKQQAILDQTDLFEPLKDLEKIPYKFGYEFLEEDNSSHSYTINDWEIVQLYRNCRFKSSYKDKLDKEKDAVEKVIQKLETFAKEKDLHFVLGNMKNHPQNFMIIGLFYPPIVQSEQLSLLH